MDRKKIIHYKPETDGPQFMRCLYYGFEYVPNVEEIEIKMTTFRMSLNP